MVKGLARRMGDRFVRKAVIRKEDCEIYVYGCELFISEIICSLILVLMGCMLGKVLESMIYLFTYTSIRVYAGGYHASSYRICISLFSVCSLGLLILAEWLSQSSVLDHILIVLLAADIIIFKFAPVEDPNKKLTESEFAKYRKIARKIVVGYSVLFVLIYLFCPYWTDEMAYAVVAICEIAVFLLAGSWKNRIRSKEIEKSVCNP